MKNSDTREMKIFSGRANNPLSEKIAQYLDTRLGQVSIKDFSDGEIWVKYEENIRGNDVFIIQPTHSPAANLLELLIMIDAARRSSADRVTAVIPYFGYARQDRKDQPRVSITAKLVANLISTAGADRVLTMDLHAPQIQGFFDIPLDHLYSSPIFTEYYRNANIDDIVVVSPDIGGIGMARAFAKRLQGPLAMLDKRRPRHNEAAITHVIGEVRNKNVLIFDDIVDTARTLVKAVEVLKKNEAKNIYIACTHAILSGDAVARIEASPISKLIVTDTVILPANKAADKIEVLSVAKLLGEGINRIHNNESISHLFD